MNILFGNKIYANKYYNQQNEIKILF